MRASSGKDFARIFCITWLRWTFTVISLTPRSPAICLLSRPVILEPGAVASEADMNGVEQILVAERLRQKLDRTSLHRLHGHGNVAMPGDEDDRELNVSPRQLTLKFEAALPGKPDIEHEAGRPTGSP